MNLESISVLFLHLFQKALEASKPQNEEQLMKVVEYVWDYLDANIDFANNQVEESLYCSGSFLENMFTELLLVSVKE